MSTVTIYGASDDLIEIEGDLNEEFTPDSDDQETWLIFSDGTILAVRYDDFGCWRITRPYIGTSEIEKSEALGEEGPRDDGKPAYSDVVTLTGNLSWVIAAEKVTFHKIAASTRTALPSPESPTGGSPSRSDGTTE